MKEKPISRFDAILPLVENRRVLDCGAADFEFAMSMRKRGVWLHEKIRNVADYTLGIDIVEESVRALCEHGYNFIVADVEDFQLDEEFEVVVAGELIEHLSNPGRFLKNAREVLLPEGDLILSTPNVFGITALVKMCLWGVDRAERDHVCWYSASTLTNLLESNGFRVEKVHYCVNPASRSLIRKIREGLGMIRPWLGDTLVLVAKPAITEWSRQIGHTQ